MPGTAVDRGWGPLSVHAWGSERFVPLLSTLREHDLIDRVSCTTHMHTQQQHPANAQIALTMDADISGGLFVKGFVLNAAQFKDCECSHGFLASTELVC